MTASWSDFRVASMGMQTPQVSPNVRSNLTQAMNLDLQITYHTLVDGHAVDETRGLL